MIGNVWIPVVNSASSLGDGFSEKHICDFPGRWRTSFPGFSYPLYESRERETLENAGHVSPRIWEITNKRFGGGAGNKCEICIYRAYTGQCSHQTVYLTWSWTRKIMHKVLWQRKRNFLQNIWMLIGCLTAMLSFGTCNGKASTTW